jgi:TonB family protein
MSFLCIGTSSLNAQQIIASAVDIKGRRHLGSRDSPGLNAPWIADHIADRAPEYPYADRAQYHQGEGFYRITLNPRTGLVTQVRVIKSTGFVSLDKSAIAALSKWRWKPGKWKEVDMPIRFQMESP